MTEPDTQVSSQKHDKLSQPTINGEQPPLRSICRGIQERIISFMEKDTKEDTVKCAQLQCRNSLNVIEEALTRYPLENIALSYNGGKDCLLLLLLYLAVLADRPNLPTSISAIYIPHTHPFPALESFVASSAAQYQLNLARHTSPKNSMKEAFTTYLSSPSGAGVKAILVGTRRTDPHGGSLDFFDKTDRGWPEFMRIHPVLGWRYAEVWAFLRHLDFEWCELYDQGYTSLGGLGDTHPNPKLRVNDEKGKELFHPAWMLEVDNEERLGRS